MHTLEQLQVIKSTGNVKCIAVAGSGKTTTQFACAQDRPKQNGLYLVYNSSNRREAVEKAAKMGIDKKKLHIHTAHSLAWKPVGSRYKKVLVKDIPLQLIINKCHLTGGTVQQRFTIASMIKEAIAIYCNKASVGINPTDLYTNFDKALVDQYYGNVLDSLRYLVDEMYYGRWCVTHDFYLKVFANLQQELGYNYILFDEAQDASDVMLDIVLRQHGAKIIVGDPAQQIYTWRGAVNALDKVNFTQKNLTNSFRFPQHIADRANAILKLKYHIGMYGSCVEVKGVGNGTQKDGKTACLSRTVTGLFKMMVDNYQANPTAHRYVEGGLKTNTWLHGGGVVSDVYNIWARKPNKVKADNLKQFKHIDELKEFAYNTNNRDLTQTIDLIQTYRGEIFSLKTAIIASLTKDKAIADFIFSTVHKAKGQEYDYVQMDNTFIREEDLLEMREAIIAFQTINGPSLSPELYNHALKLNEEINIKYVACTRARVQVKSDY